VLAIFLSHRRNPRVEAPTMGQPPPQHTTQVHHNMLEGLVICRKQTCPRRATVGLALLLLLWSDATWCSESQEFRPAASNVAVQVVSKVQYR